MTTSTTPVAGLVSGAAEYFNNVALPMVQRAVEAPNDTAAALGAFTLLFHVKDWAKRDGLIPSEADYWNTCPFGQLVAEIANGGKHAELTDRKLTTSPHVVQFRSCGFGQGGFGVGPFGTANIQVNGIRAPGEAPCWWSTKEVLETVRDWWKGRLSAP